MRRYPGRSLINGTFKASFARELLHAETGGSGQLLSFNPEGGHLFPARVSPDRGMPALFKLTAGSYEGRGSKEPTDVSRRRGEQSG